MLAQQKQEIIALFQAALAPVLAGTTLEPSVVLERPRDASHGDVACNIAMQLAKQLKQNPRELAQTIVSAVLANPAGKGLVEAVEIAGPGFINVRVSNAAKQAVVKTILSEADSYGRSAAGAGKQVILEFVSANPTGPLHVGHGRQAALGDAICNLLTTQGRAVHREYYYNDAGVQIQTLAHSTQLRAKGFKPGDACWPTDPADPASKAFYNGEYIQDIADDFLAKKTVQASDRATTANGDADDIDAIRDFAVAYLRHEQDKDLQAFNLAFDEYYLESSLYTSGRVQRTVDRLVANGKTYEQDGALWLKSTDYGDDKDRVMRKTDGSFTYFVPDVAYHISKWERGYRTVVNIQGTDHHGTIARVRAGLQAADVCIPQGYPDYVLHTMVRVVKGGEEVKISKRAGSYVTLRDLIEWTSTDAIRFFLLSRKPDTEYTFDIDLALAQNNENPVYYVQYAHARISSVLAAWGGDRGWLPHADLTPLDTPAAQALMLQLAKYPAMLTDAATHFAPHDVTFYLRDLAAAYHSYYDAERILVDDEATKNARLALVAAVAQVLHNGLAILGVSAPQKM